MTFAPIVALRFHEATASTLALRRYTGSTLGQEGSSFVRALDALGSQSFVYFVVHDDSFATFRVARDLAASRGVAVG